MTSYFSALVDFVHVHSQYTLVAIFLLALSEAIPVVGTIVPGSTLIIGLSAVATGAHANPWILLIAAITGAIIGDGLSFWLGQRYHREILSSWPLNQLQRMAGAVGSAVKGDLSLLMIGWVACQVRYVHAVSVGLRLMAVSDPCPYLGPRPDALDCAIASPN